MHRLRSHLVLIAVSLVLTGPAAHGQPASAEQEKDLLRRNVALVPDGAIAVIDGQRVTMDEFCNELASQHLRPAANGGPILQALVDSYLISRELTRYGLSVTSEELDQQIENIDQQLRKASPSSTLEESLKRNNVSLAVFKQKYRMVVGLDKLVRRSKGNNLPAGRPITKRHRDGWLKDRRDSAKIVMPPAKLPVGVVATVDGHRITTRDFAKDFLLTVEDAEAVRIIENIMQEKLILRMLASRKMKLTETDLLLEWNYRKKRFTSNPRYKGIPYDDIVKQQTGLDPASLRSSLGFRVNAAVGVMSKHWFTPVQLKESYAKHLTRYGPRLSISHILLEGSEDEFRQKTGTPTLTAAKKSAEHVLGLLEDGTRFDELARVWSADTATKKSGGVLPTFTPGRSVFEQAIIDCAMELEVGQVSKPVATRSGWHLVKLRAKEPAPPFENEGVQEDLRRFLARNAFTEAYNAARVGINLVMD